MNDFSLSFRVVWWDVSEIMTLREVEEYCVLNDVQATGDNGRMFLPVVIMEEGA